MGNTSPNIGGGGGDYCYSFAHTDIQLSFKQRLSEITEGWVGSGLFPKLPPPPTPLVPASVVNQQIRAIVIQ